MTEASGEVSLPRADLLFQVATLPALLLGYGRARIRASVRADLVTFASPAGRILFAILAAVAVVYPIVASIAHANIEAFTEVRNGTDSFAFAIFPLFDVVYAESLPFMAAAAVIGLFSPALGALFVAVFVPADLLAASASGELTNMASQFPYGAFLGRAISYLMLWLLAVEIPLQARAAGDVFGEPWDGRSAALRAAAARVVAAAVLVFIWIRSLPWVIVPLFTWSALQVVPSLATRPAWFHGHVVAGAAAIAALVAAVWPGFPAERPAEPLRAEAATARQPSLALVVVRQTIAALAFALLSAGLLTTLPEVVILLLGLILMGPVVTLVGERIPLPERLTSADRPVRWALALAVAGGLAIALLFVLGDALYTGTYTGLMAVLAASGFAFRLMLDGGRAPSDADQARAPEIPAAVTTLFSGLTVLVLWLALPALALGDDCSDLGQSELPSCAKALANAALMPPILGFIVGGAILSRAMEGKGHPPPKKTPPPINYMGGPYRPGAGKKPGPFAKKPPAPPPDPSFKDRWNDFWGNLLGF